MKTAMLIATVLVVGVALLGGIAGALWMWTLAIPIGIVLGLLMVAFGWD